jgi:hypothetical protein
MNTITANELKTHLYIVLQTEWKVSILQDKKRAGTLPYQSI